MRIKHLFMLLSVLAVVGCSENGFWFRSGSQYDQIPEKGLYYIGRPYRIKGVLYTPAEDWSYSEKGMATWYSRDDQNRLTTNGEVFDDDKMTAAHKTLPLPSLVRITNLENGNTAIVRVNDRGPAVNNRLIDVSHKTAEALEMPETGTVLVRVEILPDESRRLKEESDAYVESEPMPSAEEIRPDTPVYQPDPAAGVSIYNGQGTVTAEDLPSEPAKNESVPAVVGWRIQAGASGQEVNARRAVEQLTPLAPVTTQADQTVTKVFVGPFRDRAEVQTVLGKMRALGYGDAWIQQVK